MAYWIGYNCRPPTVAIRATERVESLLCHWITFLHEIHGIQSTAESSQARSTEIVSDFLTWGVHCLDRNMTSKHFFRAARPTILCVSPQINIVLKFLYHPMAPLVRSSTAQKRLVPQRATLTVGWLHIHLFMIRQLRNIGTSLLRG